MKSIGIVRKIDELGRLCIPKQVREGIGLEAETAVEVFYKGDEIVLRKYQPGCIFCGKYEDDLLYFKGKRLCEQCAERILKAVR